MKKANISPSILSSSLYSTIGSHSWLVGEQSALRILSTIQPIIASERKRNEVTFYLQSIIREQFGTEVFSFGSVPLKTYLPEGDIDLTVICCQNSEEELAREIFNFLESGALKDNEFVVQAVQYVRAQVSVVKCVVQNFFVDISFNQIAGINAFCFLEQADHIFGKDHLLKRSIILIKAWCYYESRILGAVHHLISTYALDLLVLHIVNLFHSSLNGPLSVLYRFLNYYCTFDWDKYCVSLNGPVLISSLPEIVVETPQNNGSDMLLLQECLKINASYFSNSTLAPKASEQSFFIKHLNIIDPLKEKNNVGRSVSKGNYHRIKSALSYGAKRLEEILMRPWGTIGNGLIKFFENTLKRNGMGRRADVRFPVPLFCFGTPLLADLTGDYTIFYTSIAFGQQFRYLNHYSPQQFWPYPSPSPTWNTRVELPLNQNFVYPRNMKVYMPMPASHPVEVKQSYISDIEGNCDYIPTVEVVEQLRSHGIGSCIRNMGTGIVVPGISVREKSIPQEGRFINEMNVKSKVNLRGGTSILDTVEEKYVSQEADASNAMGVEESSRIGGTTTYVHYVGVEGNVKKRGDGSLNFDLGKEEEYIDSQGEAKRSSGMRMNPHMKIHVREKEMDPGQTRQGLILKSFLKNDQVNVSFETREESGCCLDLSLDEFPLLPCTKKDILSKNIPQLLQPTEESTQAEASLLPLPLPLGRIKFGSFEFSITPELSESKEEMIQGKQYKLEDEDDFPLLSS